MAHFAKIENGKVTEVIVVSNNELLVDGIEVESKGAEFCQSLFGGTWVQTSYNGNIRKQYAGIGFTYDADADQFVAPQPYASWSLDCNNDRQAPTPKPEGSFTWDEETLAWVATPAI
jgi:hypothetical protein